MPDVNLGKLVPLEVYEKLKNVKIIKFFFYVGMGRAIYHWN